MKNRKIKRWKKTRILSAILTLSMLFGVCKVAAAAEDPKATKTGLRSQGAICFQEGTESVVIDSDDLYTLADRLDLFKVRVAEQLGLLGTYLSRGPAGTPLTSAEGVYAVHQKPTASGEADPASLSFETILEGIAASQTIPTDPAAYGMSVGSTLYKDADGKLYTAAHEGTEPIRIQAATAENLSAGTAAWVNGKLILGTGGDNQSYHEQGYRKGYDDRDNDDPDDDELVENGGSTSVGDAAALGKARVIDMNTGSKSYVVQEDMTDVFLCFARIGHYTTPVLSSGEPIKLVMKNYMTDDTRYAWNIYYVPSLTKGTVISNLHASTSEKVMNLLITVDGSQKGGKVNGIRLAQSKSVKDYIVEEDMTDVFFYVTSSKNKMPNFTPMDDQDYVSFKLIKEVYHSTYSAAGCLYYIPELKAGTKISNIRPYLSYLVY